MWTAKAEVKQSHEWLKLTKLRLKSQPCASCKLRKIVGECEAYVPARAVPFPPAKRVRTDHARDASSPHSQAAGRLSATIDTRTEPRFETSPSSDLFGTQRDALLVEELTELLPSERDCEILLEYLVQEVRCSTMVRGTQRSDY